MYWFRKPAGPKGPRRFESSRLRQNWKSELEVEMVISVNIARQKSYLILFFCGIILYK